MKSAEARLTPKQEAFCLAYIETGNASEAYRMAYDVSPEAKPATVNKRASELLANGEITGRLDQLRAGHIERHKVTVDDLLDELEAARLMALSPSVSAPAAAVSATMGKAKLLGFLVDKLKADIYHALPAVGPDDFC